MFLFSSLTLAGTPLLEAINLSAATAFPARQYDCLQILYRPRTDWCARPPPRNRPHLSLELGECLGSGRTAVVYAARIVEIAPVGSASDCPKPTVEDPELCVKIARPNRSRTLAREAWVYDQLKEGPVQGTCVPRCYGFFSATLSPEELPVGLWEGEPLEKDDPTRDDTLLDDKPHRVDNPNALPGARERSQWVDWKPDPDAPLLSVLVTARGGPRYTDEDEWDEDTQYVVR